MDDENAKEENEGASTSKKENNKNGKEDEDFDDREHDGRSYSESSASFCSGQTPGMRKDPNADLPKMNGKSERFPERRKRVRRGRVMKPRRSVARRRYQPVRRRVGNKRTRIAMKRDRSASSIFTNHSSRTRSGGSRSCLYCGHRCCGRRFKRQFVANKNVRRKYVKTVVRQLKKVKGTELKRLKKNLNTTVRGRKKTVAKDKTKNKLKEKIVRAESIQTGSKSKMLSPLFVGTNAALADDVPNEQQPYCLEITPKMIHETLQMLTKWKQIVPLPPILEYMKKCYPVNQNIEELTQELACKLAVATIAGITAETVKDNVRHWSLATKLMRRGLTKNHVSLFWKVYCDTMAPVRKRVPPHYQDRSKQNHGTPKNWTHRLQPTYQPPCKCHSCNCKCRCTEYAGCCCYKPILKCLKSTYSCKRNTDKQRFCKSLQTHYRSTKGYKSLGTHKQKSEHKSHKRVYLRGILKKQPRVQKSRQRKAVQRYASRKPQQITYNFLHRNSLQILRNRQQLQQSHNYQTSMQEIQCTRNIVHNAHSSIDYIQDNYKLTQVVQNHSTFRIYEPIYQIEKPYGAVNGTHIIQDHIKLTKVVRSNSSNHIQKPYLMTGNLKTMVCDLPNTKLVNDMDMINAVNKQYFYNRPHESESRKLQKAVRSSKQKSNTKTVGSSYSYYCIQRRCNATNKLSQENSNISKTNSCHCPFNETHDTWTYNSKNAVYDERRSKEEKESKKSTESTSNQNSNDQLQETFEEICKQQNVKCGTTLLRKSLQEMNKSWSV